MANDKKLSENISDFLNLMSDAGASYEYMKEKLNETDKATQDILHTLELENPDYKERAKLAKELQKIRRARRAYKDSVEELSPIVLFAANYKDCINKIKQLLGEVRKQERYHQNRQYFPRIIKKCSDANEKGR